MYSSFTRSLDIERHEPLGARLYIQPDWLSSPVGWQERASHSCVYEAVDVYLRPHSSYIYY